ncbi:acyl carrier protein [Spirosoma aureum]|jgi:acyl carrier protein|uniref:Acyl carrier protein n=1 Tax=Spirosoma aureum TaxID=2692134 RepID=A0A6G9AVV4_9BACT|nr:acyl carrier protein [Spirosoma aureum]QIP16343.1 acyl carrier protein [Spirosoma aureum]
MSALANIQDRIREIVIDVLQADGELVELTNETPFFGTEDHPGVIQDSLAILEIASRLAEEFGLMPSDLGEEAFQNLDTLSEQVALKVQENALAVV